MSVSTSSIRLHAGVHSSSADRYPSPLNEGAESGAGGDDGAVPDPLAEPALVLLEAEELPCSEGKSYTRSERIPNCRHGLPSVPIAGKTLQASMTVPHRYRSTTVRVLFDCLY